MKILRYLFASALFWLVFLAGYLCRDVLGEWLMGAHSGSFGFQIVAVSSALFRVFLTFVLVAIVVTICVFIVFFVSAALQELWYQFFQRKIVSMLSNSRRSREEDKEPAGDEESIGAPTSPVNARKHARQGREVANNSPEGGGEKPLSRLAMLALQGTEDKKAEDDLLDDVEIKVTIDP